MRGMKLSGKRTAADRSLKRPTWSPKEQRQFVGISQVNQQSKTTFVRQYVDTGSFFVWRFGGTQSEKALFYRLSGTLHENFERKSGEEKRKFCGLIVGRLVFTDVECGR